MVADIFTILSNENLPHDIMNLETSLRNLRKPALKTLLKAAGIYATGNIQELIAKIINAVREVSNSNAT
jgi:hypothetical protein